VGPARHPPARQIGFVLHNRRSRVPLSLRGAQQARPRENRGSNLCHRNWLCFVWLAVREPVHSSVFPRHGRICASPDMTRPSELAILPSAVQLYHDHTSAQIGRQVKSGQCSAFVGRRWAQRSPCGTWITMGQTQPRFSTFRRALGVLTWLNASCHRRRHWIDVGRKCREETEQVVERPWALLSEELKPRRARNPRRRPRRSCGR
jgi:hypothetical protein